ncbi:MAG TPA: hypothetical protein VFX29_02130, partial [Longimicrobiaceae bacterium]|nr:hypothetical protein [Longimicrobiaceae bacterium]
MMKTDPGAALLPTGALAAADDAQALRDAGHALIERMADYLAHVDERPVSTTRAPAEIAARFAEPLPRAGRAADEVWDETWRIVAEDSIHLAHPMYMGHQVAPPLPPAVLADLGVLLAALRSQPPEGGPFVIASVADEFFVIARQEGLRISLLLSDLT